jgi:transposase
MEDAKRRSRRKHSAELKARVLLECAQPGTSVAGIAQKNGLNANLVHRWRRLASEANTPPGAMARFSDDASAFVPLTLPPQRTPAAQPDIRIELRRGATVVNIHWPVQGGADCAAWLGEWLR